jgi:hypothetical protein
MNPGQSCDHKGIIAQVGGVIQGFPSEKKFILAARKCKDRHSIEPKATPVLAICRHPWVGERGEDASKNPD